MLFRSLLLCALVSYVAVVAASPTEDSSPGSKKVEVENVESATQDSDLTDLEDISIEGEVINLDSEEHPESAGLFKKIGEKIGDAGAKIKTAGRNAADKVRRVADKTKDAVRKGADNIKGAAPAKNLRSKIPKPVRGQDLKQPSRPGDRSRPRHGPKHGTRYPPGGVRYGPGHGPRHRPEGVRYGPKPGRSDSRPERRNIIHRYHHVPQPQHPGFPHGGSDSHPQPSTQETTTAKEPGFIDLAAQSFTSSFAMGVGAGLSQSIVDGTNRLIKRGIDSIGAKPAERQKEPDYQYDNHYEGVPYYDDNNEDDPSYDDNYYVDNNDNAPDYEEDGEACKKSAINHCFEKDKDPELVKKCMAEYKCSKD